MPLHAPLTSPIRWPCWPEIVGGGEEARPLLYIILVVESSFGSFAYGVMLLGLLFPKLASYHWRQVEVARLLGKLRRREPKVRDGVLFASPTIKLECGAPDRGYLRFSDSSLRSWWEGKKEEGFDVSRSGALQGIGNHAVGWALKAVILFFLNGGRFFTLSIN
jgi:hypothetical protein